MAAGWLASSPGYIACASSGGDYADALSLCAPVACCLSSVRGVFATGTLTTIIMSMHEVVPANLESFAIASTAHVICSGGYILGTSVRG